MNPWMTPWGLWSWLSVSESAKEVRRSACRETDKVALRAIAQAAVEVELFTIPLYMGTLYSIQGMHQITQQGEEFYKGRLWPGPATIAQPKTENGHAFNIIFSVFIEEMLHLQIAANMASAIGVTPTFTTLAPQKDGFSWTCYGPDKTVIPHIVDLQDTTIYENVKVNIAALSRDQLQLFKAIEQPEKDILEAREQPAGKPHAKGYFKHGCAKKYLIGVEGGAPFASWEEGNPTSWKEGKPLPMFGSIGEMYQYYYDYMNLCYKDDPDKKLWHYMFEEARKKGSRQNDLFNFTKSPGHPMPEYSFPTKVTETDSKKAFDQVVAMMNAITDQGEGSKLKEKATDQGEGSDEQDLRIVQIAYQASPDALVYGYPSYTDTGQLTASADTWARIVNGVFDHYERFDILERLVDKVTTWPKWRDEQIKKGSQVWSADLLQTSEHSKEPQTSECSKEKYGLPSTAAIANAMNNIGNPQKDGELDEQTFQKNYEIFSKVAVGSIAGITAVLDQYWDPNPDYENVSFPSPSMYGSGDRMAICWALFGKAPDLSINIGKTDENKLYHACQALDFNNPKNNCAEVDIFHSCRGSNQCKAQGGCGFVQDFGGGETVLFSDLIKSAIEGEEFSAPSDNKCRTFGGCAVPISASQVFPRDGDMKLFDFDENNNSVEISGDEGKLHFQKGDAVYDVAYRAYQQVMKHRGKEQELPSEKPTPNHLRLVFPPST